MPGLDAWEPERDVYEIFLVREAWQRSVPLFGICRGMQVTNVALGGSLWQDIPRQCPNALLHRQESDVRPSQPFGDDTRRWWTIILWRTVGK